MTAVYDQQTGKIVAGEVRNLREYSFELWKGEERYVFSRDNLPEEKKGNLVPFMNAQETQSLQNKSEGKD